MSAFISMHAAARDETRRQGAVADLLRGRAHTRASVAGELAQPAAAEPLLFQAVKADLSKEAQA